MTDLLLVVPDRDTEQTFEGLLPRHQSLGIRAISHRTLVHPHKDPGCYGTAHELASGFAKECSYALVVFDAAWDGAPTSDRFALAQPVENKLRTAWGDRCRCIVISPELEVWVWSPSPRVEDAMGWRDRDPKLRAWLQQQNLWPAEAAKPPDPERAFREAMRKVHLPPSSSIFRQLAASVGLKHCEDAAFQEILGILRGWFPLAPPNA